MRQSETGIFADNRPVLTFPRNKTGPQIIMEEVEKTLKNSQMRLLNLMNFVYFT